MCVRGWVGVWSVFGVAGEVAVAALVPQELGAQPTPRVIQARHPVPPPQGGHQARRCVQPVQGGQRTQGRQGTRTTEPGLGR